MPTTDTCSEVNEGSVITSLPLYLALTRSSQVQRQAGDDRSLVHLAAGVGGRHDLEAAWLGLLQEAPLKRRDDRAGKPAGLRHAQARRAADRGRRARFLRRRPQDRGPSDQDALPVGWGV